MAQLLSTYSKSLWFRFQRKTHPFRVRAPGARTKSQRWHPFLRELYFRNYGARCFWSHWGNCWHLWKVQDVASRGCMKNIIFSLIKLISTWTLQLQFLLVFVNTLYTKNTKIIARQVFNVSKQPRKIQKFKKKNIKKGHTSFWNFWFLNSSRESI